MVTLPAVTERRATSVGPEVALIVAVLAVSNVANNLLLPAWAYVPWNMAVAGAIVAIAFRKVTPEQVGFTEWKRGARWGLVLLAGMVVILGIGLAIPSLRSLFDDDRVDGSTVLWAYHVFIRIPFGTVGLEEVAFRAVLPGLLAVRLGVLRACIWTSVLFGLWHVLAAWNVHEANSGIGEVVGTGLGGQAVTVTLAVLGTMVVGLWWCWVRYHSGSVLATMIGHVSSNSLAYTIAWLLSR